MIRAIAFGVVCLAGLSAIGATAKKSAPPLSEVFPTVTGNKADRLSVADGQDTLTSADRVDVAYVSPTDRSKLATTQSNNQTKGGFAPSNIMSRHYDPNKEVAAVSLTDASSQGPKKSKDVDRAKTSLDLGLPTPRGPCRVGRALNLPRMQHLVRYNGHSG